MKFNHLIEINDPRNPLLVPLTREQLWRGLVLRAEQPQLFMPHLDECTIADHDGVSMRRALRYGGTVIHDHVRLLPQQQVQYRVPAQDEIAASRLDMTIEEPQPGVLFVRFAYDHDEAGGAADDTAGDEAQSMFENFRRSAYHEADIDTIALIRRMAAEGRLDPH